MFENTRLVNSEKGVWVNCGDSINILEYYLLLSKLDDS